MTLLDEPKVDSSEVKRHRFTVDQYMDMASRRIFGEQRVELIDGEILDMSPRQPPHRRAVTRCFWLTRKLYEDPTQFFVVSQGTLRLNNDAPEPDLYVLPCGEDTPEANYPLPLWVLEIADTTYDHDAGRKLATYARHGILAYLILDIQRRQLEVYHNPIANAEGWTYASRQILLEKDVFSPFNGPRVEMPVKAMLP